MKCNSLLSVCCMTLLLLSSCGGGGKSASCLADGSTQGAAGSTGGTAGDTLALRYARRLSIVEYDSCAVASLVDPWDTTRILHRYVLVPAAQPLPELMPEGTLLRTPLSHTLVYTSVHCGLLHELRVGQAIAGVCDLSYIDLSSIHEGVAQGRITDCGSGMSPDIERIMALRPDAILLSPFENSGGYGRLEQLGIPLVECADYMETSPLGRAEWVRFYGRLYGCASQADSLFAAVEQRYLALKTLADATTTRPLVLMELKSNSAWYVPGGQSTTGILCRDAGARYAFAHDTHSGSVPLSLETVFARASEADYWLFKYNRPREMTYRDLEADYAGYAAFRPFRERKIYVCHTGKVPFYEETPFHPDRLLSDLLHIFHPELVHDTAAEISGNGATADLAGNAAGDNTGNAAGTLAGSEGLHYFCRLKQ